MSVQEHVQLLLNEKDLRYDQRFQESDLRYEQRFTALNERLQQRFDAQTAAITAALQAAKEAVDKSESASDKRFEGVNEFRAAYEKLITVMMPRAEAESAFKAVEMKVEQGVAGLATRIDDNGLGLSKMLLRSEYDAGHRALEIRVTELTQRMDRNEGRRAGLGGGWIYLIGGVGLIATIIAIYMAIQGAGAP